MKADLGTEGDLGQYSSATLKIGKVGDRATETGDEVRMGEVEALDCGDVGDEVLA